MKNDVLSSGISHSTYRHENDGFFLRTDDCFEKIKYSDLLCVEASGSYSYLHLRGKRKLMVSFRLGELFRYLPSPHFVRVHRGFVLSLFDIDRVTHTSLKLDGVWYPIGDLYRPALWKLLNILRQTRE